jgi:hypothetical protein
MACWPRHTVPLRISTPQSPLPAQLQEVYLGPVKVRRKLPNAQKVLASTSNPDRGLTVSGTSSCYVMNDETRNINSERPRVITGLVGPDILKCVSGLDLGKFSESK